MDPPITPTASPHGHRPVLTPPSPSMLWAGEGRGCHIRPHQRLQASCLLQSGCAALQRDSAHSLASHPPPPALRPTSGGHTPPHFGGTLPIACLTPRAAPCPTYPPPQELHCSPCCSSQPLAGFRRKDFLHLFIIFFHWGGWEDWGFLKHRGVDCPVWCLVGTMCFPSFCDPGREGAVKKQLAPRRGAEYSNRPLVPVSPCTEPHCRAGAVQQGCDSHTWHVPTPGTKHNAERRAPGLTLTAAVTRRESPAGVPGEGDKRGQPAGDKDSGSEGLILRRRSRACSQPQS